MAKPDELPGGLPDILRNANRPIVIYQGGAPPNEFAQATNALGVLVWLALITLCLAVAGGYAWRVWGVGNDRSQFSPVYAEGRPVGLMGRLEERRRINASADGLIEFRDDVRADNVESRITTVTHSLFTDRDGIDALRREWDALCAGISARIFERRIGEIDSQAVALRQRRLIETDPAGLARIDAELARLRQQRSDQIERRRTGADPSLRCTPAAEAPVCSGADEEPWCNPQLGRPEDFTDEAR
jgi:hypothetical protein